MNTRGKLGWGGGRNSLSFILYINEVEFKHCFFLQGNGKEPNSNILVRSSISIGGTLKLDEHLTV